MPLRDQRHSRAFSLGELGQRVGEVRALLDRSEVPAGARTQPVPELVDRPQVDACGVEGEAVAVIDAGVLAEPVQEDHDGARLGRSPVPVVGLALLVVDEWHAHQCARVSANRAINYCHRNYMA